MSAFIASDATGAVWRDWVSEVAVEFVSFERPAQGRAGVGGIGDAGEPVPDGDVLQHLRCLVGNTRVPAVPAEEGRDQIDQYELHYSAGSAPAGGGGGGGGAWSAAPAAAGVVVPPLRLMKK